MAMAMAGAIGGARWRSPLPALSYGVDVDSTRLERAHAQAPADSLALQFRNQTFCPFARQRRAPNTNSFLAIFFLAKMPRRRPMAVRHFSFLAISLRRRPLALGRWRRRATGSMATAPGSNERLYCAGGGAASRIRSPPGGTEGSTENGTG